MSSDQQHEQLPTLRALNEGALEGGRRDAEKPVEFEMSEQNKDEKLAIGRQLDEQTASGSDGAKVESRPPERPTPFQLSGARWRTLLGLGVMGLLNGVVSSEIGDSSRPICPPELPPNPQQTCRQPTRPTTNTSRTSQTQCCLSTSRRWT